MTHKKQYTINGVTKTLSEWAKEHGIPYGILYGRIKNGHSLEKSLNLKIVKQYTINGVTKTLSEWAKEHGIPYNALYGRIKNGRSLEESLYFKKKKHKKHKRHKNKKWHGQKLQQLLDMRNNHATLKEMSKKFNVTRERIRQILKRESLTTLVNKHPDYIALSICAKKLKTSTVVVHKLLHKDEIKLYNKNCILIHKSLIEILRDRLIGKRTKTCIICNLQFVSRYQKLYCSNKCSTNRPRILGISQCSWHQKLQTELQNHKPQEWGTISELDNLTILSKMQIEWLRLKGILTTKPHLFKLWRGKPVKLYSLSEIKIAEQTYKEYDNKMIIKKERKI